jgi:hypothetical protein
MVASSLTRVEFEGSPDSSTGGRGWLAIDRRNRRFFAYRQ